MATIVALAVLILVAFLLISKKALHHSSQSKSAPTPPAATSPVKTVKPAATAGGVPGGVPVSNRNPFQG
jgi:ABC-type oligopeptide transport system substrate-binding subunit